MDKLGVQKHLPSDDMRKLITIAKPKHSHIGCAFCLGDEEIIVVVSPYSGESVMMCKPCLQEIAGRSLK